MFKDFIFQLLETLISTDVATVFTEPLALLCVFMLIFVIFSMFTSASTKKVLLVCMLIMVMIFATFMLANQYGLIMLPVTLGG